MDRVEGNLQEAKLEITLKERQPLEIEKLREAVVKAGFTPNWIRFRATGKLVVQNGLYGLKVEGTGQLLELVKDERSDSLVKTLAGETRLIDILAVFPKEKQSALLEEFSIR